MAFISLHEEKRKKWEVYMAGNGFKSQKKTSTTNSITQSSKVSYLLVIEKFLLC
jgi:hypothetical protein